MHDGSVPTLAAVVALYDVGGIPNLWLSRDIRPLGLTAQERSDLVEFMNALTGEIAAEVDQAPMLPN